MSDIQGTSPAGPQPTYEQEYKHGVDLFQRALAEYSRADEPHKKEAFRQVMDKALQVLNETARGMKRQDLLKQNAKIEQDYLAYQSSDGLPDKRKLSKDLEQAKKTFT